MATPSSPLRNRTNLIDKTHIKPLEKSSEEKGIWHEKSAISGPFASALHKNHTNVINKCSESLENSKLKRALQPVYVNLTQMSRRMQLQTFMELIDLSKRENNLKSAKSLLAIASKMLPTAPQVWLEHGKLEEECGRLASARKQLLIGLQFCPNNEQLSIKLLKVEEKIGDITISRQLLGSLSKQSIEKHWKVLLEGSLMEARAGNISLARHLLQSLVQCCGSFGALHQEFIKFEEKYNRDLKSTLSLCENGLFLNAKYSPLWFSSLRVLERLFHDHPHEISKKQQELMIKAPQHLTKELLWKLYLEYAMYLDNRNNRKECRQYLKEAAISAPGSLRWKVWVAGSRFELKSGNIKIAFHLLSTALNEVPNKQEPLVLIEMSKAYEFLSVFHMANKLIIQAYEQSKMNWKVYLELISLQMRMGCLDKALVIAKEAINKHSSTGRLWASLIQLLHSSPECCKNGQHFKSFLLAIQEVPKSGEVWCEGARIRLNPFFPYFSPEKAEEYLNYAIQFTPQYGDSFIEMLRAYLLQGKLHEIKALKRACVSADPNYGMLWFYFRRNQLDGARQVWKNAKRSVCSEVIRTKPAYLSGEGNSEWAQVMWAGVAEVAWSFTRNSLLGSEARLRLIYGSEGFI